MCFQMLGLITSSVSSVLRARHGVIFLGTPHHESITAPWHLIIQRIIQSATIPDVATPPNLTEEKNQIEAGYQLFDFDTIVTPLVYTFIETDSVSCYCYRNFVVLLLIINIDYATGMYKTRMG
jgi:hypothetical protein